MSSSLKWPTQRCLGSVSTGWPSSADPAADAAGLGRPRLQPAHSRARLVAPGVRDGDRGEAVVARSQLVGQVADGELGLALEDVEGLLERVAMGGGRRAGWQLAEPDLQVDRALEGADQGGHAQAGQVLVISPPLLVETGHVEGHGSPRSGARGRP